MFYEAWKHGNFAPTIAAQVLSSDAIAAYFSGPYGRPEVRRDP